MTKRYRDLSTGTDMVFLPSGGFRRAGYSYARNHLELATDQELADLSIEAYEHIPPPPVDSSDPNDYPLLPFQFFAMLEILGKSEAVYAAIDEIVDTTERAIAKAKLQHAQIFERNDPHLTTLLSATALKSAKIDAAWMQAKDIV